VYASASLTRAPSYAKKILRRGEWIMLAKDERPEVGLTESAKEV